MIRRVGLAGGMAVLLCAGAALALDADAQIKARQDYYKAIGRTMKGLMEELKKPAPSTAELQKDAAFIDSQAPKLVSYFPDGTGLDHGYKTGAKPEIWRNPAEFKKDAAAFADAAHKLDATAQTGDAAAIRAAARDMGQACKACHETFRKEEH